MKKILQICCLFFFCVSINDGLFSSCKRQHDPEKNKIWLRKRETINIELNREATSPLFGKIHADLSGRVSKDREIFTAKYKKAMRDQYQRYQNAVRDAGLQMERFAGVVGNFARGTISIVTKTSHELVVSDDIVCGYDTRWTGLNEGFFSTAPIPSKYIIPKAYEPQYIKFGCKPVTFKYEDISQNCNFLTRLLNVKLLLEDRAYSDTELQILSTLFNERGPQFWVLIDGTLGRNNPVDVQLITLHIHTEQAPCGLCSALLVELSKQLNCPKLRTPEMNLFLGNAAKTNHKIGQIIQQLNRGQTKFLITVSSDAPDGNRAVAASTDCVTLEQLLFGSYPTEISTGAPTLETAAIDFKNLFPPCVIFHSLKPFPVSDAETKIEKKPIKRPPVEGKERWLGSEPVYNYQNQ